MKNSSHGTAVVLIIDLLAAMASAVFATFYLKLGLEFLIVFSLITFGLFAIISVLLARSSRRPDEGEG